MTIPRRRLAIVTGALIVLSAVGGGLAQAASTSSTLSASITTSGATDAVVPATATMSTETGADLPLFAGERLRALRDRFGDGNLARLRRHLVHGTVTVLDRDDKLVTLQLDHGTISAIGASSITIAEAGGSSVTVATNADTRVRKDRKPGSLAALAVGDEVVVKSVVDGGSATARRIVVPAPVPGSAGQSGAS